MSGEIKEDAAGDVIVATDVMSYMAKRNNTKIEQILVSGALIDDIVSFKFRGEYTSVDVVFIGISSVDTVGTNTKYEPADEATGIIGLLPYEQADFESYKE